MLQTGLKVNSYMKMLSWFAVGVTFAQLVFGKYRLVTDLPLSCAHWPLCSNSLSAAENIAGTVSELEWLYRGLSLSSILAVVSLIVLSRVGKSTPNVKRAGLALLALILSDILIGSLSFAFGMTFWIKSILYISASLILCALINLAIVATWDSPVVTSTNPKIRRLAVSGFFALLIQFLLGALVRNMGTGLACPNFPSCGDGFFPSPFSVETGLVFLHRWWGILMIGVLAHIGFAAPKLLPELARTSRKVFALGVVQIIFGIGTVATAMAVNLRILHAATGFLLLANLFFLVIRSGGLSFFWKTKTPS